MIRTGRLSPGYALICPAMALIAAIAIYPLIYATWASFTNLRMTSPVWRYDFVGTYNGVISSSIFHHSLFVTAVFIAAAIILEFFIGFALALSFNAMRYTHPLLRALIMLPVMATPVSVGLIWKLMLNSDFGIITQLGEVLGLGRIPWLSNPSLALVSVVVMDVWQWTPFVFLILLAGLEALPKDVYEAAEIEGASWGQTFFLLTVPLVRPIMMLALVFRLMFAVATFDTVFVLTKGGPARATDLITLYLQRDGLVNLNLASASAASFLLLIVIYAGTKLLLKKGMSQ